MAAFNFAPIIALLALGSFGLPLGIPPQPEDALMSKIAPEECVFYTTWAGTATPDPASTNQTEQLLAEPEIKYLLAMLEQKIMAGLQESAGQDPDAAPVIKDASKWGKRLLTSPTAIFVSKADMTEEGPDVRGGMLVKVGNDVAQLKAKIEEYQKTFLKDMCEQVMISGTACYRINMPPPVPPVTWGIKGTYLIVGLGEGEVEGMLNRAVTPPPQWLTGIRTRLKVSRQSTMTYINVETLLKTFAPMGGEEAATVIEALGLKNINTLASVTGLDQEGIVSRTLVGIAGEPQGLLAALIGGQLTADDLAPVPGDATIAMVAKLDAATLFNTILAVADKVEPGTGDEILGGLGEMEEELGINLREDILAPLGDTWCVYNSPREGGLVVTGLTLVVKVDDRAKLAAVEAKLLKIAADAQPKSRPKVKSKPKMPVWEQGGETEMPSLMSEAPRRRVPRIEHFRFAGSEVYMLNARDDDFPLAPSWCLTEKELIVAPYPQNIKAYLIRGADYKSLATSPAVSGFLQTAPTPSFLTYIDTKSLFELVYPMIPIVGQVASAEMARDGIDFDISILPSAGCISKHLRPDVMAVRRTDAGIEVISRRTNPVLSIGSAVPTSIAAMVPAVVAARSAAQRANALNNLKQIGLAMQNHDSVFRRFPASYSVDKEGKPLLSWRVRILPFIENKPLYEAFHLDEPWDSPHNKKLIEMMPLEYMSPGIETPPGMTHYLAICGPDTAFPPGKGIGLGDIRDGTSNTIMVVESTKAVPWTKPEDLTFDPKNPAAGLFGLRPGVCNATMCDGSVQSLPESIDPEMLGRFLMRNDGKEAPYVHDRPGRSYGRPGPVPKRPAPKELAPEPKIMEPESPFGKPTPKEIAPEPKIMEPESPFGEPAKRPAPKKITPKPMPTKPDSPFGAPSTPPAVPGAPAPAPKKPAPAPDNPFGAPGTPPAVPGAPSTPPAVPDTPAPAPKKPAPAPDDPFGAPSTPAPAPDIPAPAPESPAPVSGNPFD